LAFSNFERPFVKDSTKESNSTRFHLASVALSQRIGVLGAHLFVFIFIINFIFPYIILSLEKEAMI